jgi:hypothetical protein
VVDAGIVTVKVVFVWRSHKEPLERHWMSRRCIAMNREHIEMQRHG